MEDGQYKERNKELQSLQKSSSKADPAAAIDQETKLPIEGIPLLQLDVRKSAICMLMAEAKANGKRLSVVMKAVWHNIYRLRGREVVAYLSCLLKQDRDFASRAREHDEQIVQQRYRNTLHSLDSRYHGHQVLNSSWQGIGTFVCSDGGTPRIERYDNGRLSVSPVNLNFARLFADGELRLSHGMR